MNNITILSKEIRQFDNLFCLNDLHKASGSEAKNKPAEFLRIGQTKSLINAIESKGGNSHQLNSSNGSSLILRKKSGVGTFACKQIVLAYGMWISPEVNLAVIDAFLDQQENQQPQLEQEEPVLSKDQAGHIYQTVMDMVKNNKGTYQGLFSSLKKKFNRSSYKSIKACDYPVACQLLGIAPLTKPIGVNMSEDEKYKLANKMIEALDLKDQPMIVPYEHIVNLTRQIRGMNSAAKIVNDARNDAESCIDKIIVRSGLMLN